MPITGEQIAQASAGQHAAARDPADQVRLVAGPGTGKSSAIEERVRWLLDEGVAADAIAVVSFTRAAAFDLRGRIGAYCLANGQPAGADVRVSTLHSLALRTLRIAGALGAYPVDPGVLDEWELRHILDAEFGNTAGIAGVIRPAAIRRDHEAYWSTGQHTPPNITPPVPPISEDERTAFRRFHGPRTQLYSCVLPGELIRQCVERIEAGTLELEEVLGVEQLIVDEFQDLNPMDLQFVDALIDQGAIALVAGDDDQSLYSFRFASPQGIREFLETHPTCTDHSLDWCFRCVPTVLNAATSLIESHAPADRIEKDLTSLYEASDPPVEGAIGCASYSDGRSEAAAVAGSCRALITAGMPPRSILVLLSNQRAQAHDLFEAFGNADVPYEPPKDAAFRDEAEGRVAFALTRLVISDQDYVAYRTVLGCLDGVGVGTCNAIAAASIDASLNYRDLFTNPLPEDVFTGRAERALTRAQNIVAEVLEWSADETIDDRREDYCRLINAVLNDDECPLWTEYIARLPGGMLLSELATFLMSDKEEQQQDLLQDVYRRLDEDMPEEIFPPKVRVMSMHGAKGLSARVVFIPGLEEEILPGPRRRPYPGQVLEAARMLYVSITRARLACVMTYARSRFMNGAVQSHSPSRFTNDLGHPFSRQNDGLSVETAERLCAEASNL